MSGGEKDLIQQLNEEAEYNVKTQDHHGNQIRFFGDYDFVPVPEDRSIKIKEFFKELNHMMWNTARNLSLPQNHIDLQDRVFNRVQWYTSDVNRCVKASRNVKEVNNCCDVYLSKLNSDLRREVIDILKEY